MEGEKRNTPTFSSCTNHISRDIIIICIAVANGGMFLTHQENSIILLPRFLEDGISFRLSQVSVYAMPHIYNAVISYPS